MWIICYVYMYDAYRDKLVMDIQHAIDSRQASEEAASRTKASAPAQAAE